MARRGAAEKQVQRMSHVNHSGNRKQRRQREQAHAKSKADESPTRATVQNADWHRISGSNPKKSTKSPTDVANANKRRRALQPLSKPKGA